MWWRLPWPLFKAMIAVLLAAHGLRRWRWDWFRCAWRLLWI
jgi:hypothetical protein